MKLAIAFFGMWEGDSEALLQAVRCFEDEGRAIAKRCCKQFAFWGVRGNQLRDVESAIAVGRC